MQLMAPHFREDVLFRVPRHTTGNRLPQPNAGFELIDLLNL